MYPLRFQLSKLFLLALVTCFARQALAVDPIPVTANDAFDAYATQTDPQTGYEKTVAIVDVRSRAEYFWVGTATRVDEIELKDGSTIAPDLGKVLLDHEGKFLTYTLNGRNKRVQVKKVNSVNHSPISINIPFKLWDEQQAKLVGNPQFLDGIASLVSDGIQVIILYCRTGGRSTDCAIQTDAAIFDSFNAVYEIDDPANRRGFGGFEGSSYGNAYNGYLGFPGRQTGVQTVPSASWKDTGLPMKTLINPLQ
jgi:rhodanese-related sulfurtransferase